MKISFHMEMLKNNCNRKIEDIKSSISKDVPSIRVLECEVLDNIYGSDFSEKMNISPHFLKPVWIKNLIIHINSNLTPETTTKFSTTIEITFSCNNNANASDCTFLASFWIISKLEIAAISG